MFSQTRLSELRTTYPLVSRVKFHIHPFSMAIFLSRKMCSVSTPFFEYARMHQRVIDSRPFKRKCAFIFKVLEVLLTQEGGEEGEGGGGGGEGGREGEEEEEEVK